LRELVATASETMSNLKISQEKAVMKRFLKEVTKTENSLAVYGEKQVRKALEMGVVDTLLLSDNLRKFHVKLKCPSCSYMEERTIDEEALTNFTPPDCSKCNSSNTMEILEKIDLIDELSDLAETTGCSVRLISQDSEEGDSLYSAFNGIAGILRYPIEI
jgi:peptide chain release factor subunit 1